MTATKNRTARRTPRRTRRTRGRQVARVLRWGNSAAVLLPKFVAEAAHLPVGTQITFALHNGGVLLRPARKLPSVSELLDGVTPENVERLEWGPPRGREAIR